MSETNLGVKIFNPPFTRQLEKMEKAASAYFENPVHVKLSITLMDPNDPSVDHTDDEVTVAIVNVDHKSADKNIVLLRAKVVEASKRIKTVPTFANGSPDADVEVLRTGDNVVMIVDVAYGVASIIQVSDDNAKSVFFDDLSVMFPRLELPAGLPDSTGTPVEWDSFTP